MNEGDIRRVVRTELEAQAASDWARLAAVPCTFTWRAIDYMKRLAPDRRAALFTVLEDAALFFFDPSRDPGTHPARINDPEYERLRAGSGGQSWDWKYVDVRMLRAVLGGARSRNGAVAAELAAIPPEVLARAERIVPIKAPQIRQLVKAAVQRRFGATPQKSGGGDWTYPGTWGGVEFVLAIDYGGWDQLRYDVSYEHSGTGTVARRLNYERLLGCGGTGWNFLTADNAVASVELLLDCVEWLVSVPARI